jgi:hypothetical protein
MPVSLLVYGVQGFQTAQASPGANQIPITNNDGSVTFAGAVTGTTLTSNGSAFLGLSSKTTSYTASATSLTDRISAASGNVTATLPPAASCAGLLKTIKRTDSVTGNSITIQANGSELIDGANTNTSLTTQYSVLRLQSNGVGWDIL